MFVWTHGERSGPRVIERDGAFYVYVPFRFEEGGFEIEIQHTANIATVRVLPHQVGFFEDRVLLWTLTSEISGKIPGVIQVKFVFGSKR